MNNPIYKGQKNTYTVLRELGKGGEGSVYTLAGNSMQVLKVYTEPLTTQKVRKLNLMAQLHNPRIEEYAAWPADVVVDGRNIVAGFVMKKLVDFYPLHMLFSPMDRKKIFPDKGYNFLVHVARNLAAAFQALHSAGLVVGDVNEGNILVNARGMIAFIDCDSFQVKDGTEYHFCEVGVPRYTPPELLANASFENVVRSVNTDSFSMAILIFQLLFLGRHPFAGRNNTSEDIDEETAIKQHLFAFSLRNKHNKLLPPNDSFSLSYLNEGLANLFQNAFEKNDGRPVPAEWIKELDVYLKAMVVCSKTKLHTYPSSVKECMWCAFKEKRNILYFFDDSYLQNSQLLQDIDKFINGFKVKKIQLEQIIPASLPVPKVPTPVIGKKYRQYRIFQIATIVFTVGAGIGLISYTSQYTLLTFFVAAILNWALPWGRVLKQETAKRKDAFTTLQAKFNASIEQHNKPTEVKTYYDTAEEITGLIAKFRNLPNDLQTRKREAEERLYNVQLHIFLSRVYVQGHTIPSFGEARKKLLYNSGILNAADISKLHTTKIQGIGPAYMQVLLSWQRQVGSAFVYMPDNEQLSREFAIITADVDGEKKNLENSIRGQYQQLQYIKQSITTKQALLKKQVNVLYVKLTEAEAEYDAFKKAVGVK